MPVQVMLPDDLRTGEARPLIIALHGFGGSAAGFERIARELAGRGLLVALPQSPYALRHGKDLGYDWTLNQQQDPALRARAARLVVESLPGLVDELRRRHAVTEVYLLGYSQGALVALLAGLHHPAVFAGLVTLGLPAFDAAWTTVGAADSIPQGRILLLHGIRDEVAPLAVSRQAHEALVQRGYAAKLREFSGGHSIPLNELPAIADWISAGTNAAE